MVGLVLVSHSPQIAEGTAELVRQMAGEVELAAVGGDAEGGFGTDPDRIREAIENLHADEVLVFMDLGSAVLSAETVLEMFSSEERERSASAWEWKTLAAGMKACSSVSMDGRGARGSVSVRAR